MRIGGAPLIATRRQGFAPDFTLPIGFRHLAPRLRVPVVAMPCAVGRRGPVPMREGQAVDRPGAAQVTPPTAGRPAGGCKVPPRRSMRSSTSMVEQFSATCRDG
jgi:hypothetical protein